jgi:cysteine desulfurase
VERPIYLDYNATTPIDPGVVETMLPFLRDQFGNPSSSHIYGLQASRAVEVARRQVASLLCAEDDEIVFTGGGSETDNLAIKGAVFPRLEERPHIVSSAVEHPAVLNTLSYLRERFNINFTLVPVDEFGQVDPESVRRALQPETVLVTLMHANNEVGTIEPIAEVAGITRARGVLLHVDAAQSAGKIPIDVNALGIDLMTVAGHKLYGPKGIGALFIRRGTQIDPLIHGSGQELGMRAGTENVASIVGLGKAADLALADLPEECERLCGLRDRLLERLCDSIPDLAFNGHPVRRLPNTLNVSFPGASGASVLGMAPSVAASTGAACHSSLSDPSPVLSAMGLSRERAAGAVRLSLGRWTTENDVKRAACSLADAHCMLAS